VLEKLEVFAIIAMPSHCVTFPSAKLLVWKVHPFKE